MSMIESSMEAALNDQMNAEMESAYLYMGMAAYFESINLKGFAHWMVLQANEENEHARKFYSYLFGRGGTARFDGMKAVPNKYKSPLAAFEAAYNHELKVTELIHTLLVKAHEAGDPATVQFLQWFVEEQVEEEASADEIVQQLKMIGDAPGPLMMLNAHLAKRGRE